MDKKIERFFELNLFLGIFCIFIGVHFNKIKLVIFGIILIGWPFVIAFFGLIGLIIYLQFSRKKEKEANVPLHDWKKIGF